MNRYTVHLVDGLAVMVEGDDYETGCYNSSPLTFYRRDRNELGNLVLVKGCLFHPDAWLWFEIERKETESHA